MESGDSGEMSVLSGTNHTKFLRWHQGELRAKTRTRKGRKDDMGLEDAQHATLLLVLESLASIYS